MHNETQVSRGICGSPWPDEAVTTQQVPYTVKQAFTWAAHHRLWYVVQVVGFTQEQKVNIIERLSGLYSAKWEETVDAVQCLRHKSSEPQSQEATEGLVEHPTHDAETSRHLQSWW